MFVPVYHELVDKMKAGIRSGDLSGKLPGVRVLGRQFGVNPATISKALRVLEEKGYVSIILNSGAFVIPRGNTISNHTIGVICIRRSGEEEVTEQRYLNSRYHYSPYTVSQIAAEIDGEAARAGFHAILVHIGAEQLRQNPAYLTTLPVDGMIFIFSSLTYEIADVLKKKHIPFISANACYGISEVNYIDFNMAQGIGDFLDELRARGYTRIGYFGPPGKYGFNERVYNLFRKKLGPLFRPHLFAAEAESFDLEFSREDESPEARARALIGTPGELPEVILCNADLADPRFIAAGGETRSAGDFQHGIPRRKTQRRQGRLDRSGADQRPLDDEAGQIYDTRSGFRYRRSGSQWRAFLPRALLRAEEVPGGEVGTDGKTHRRIALFVSAACLGMDSDGGESGRNDLRGI